MVLIGVASGAALAVGVMAVVLGLRGAPAPAPLRRRLHRGNREWQLVRLAAAFAAAAGMLVLTSWPVGALLAAVVAGMAPGTLGRLRAETETVARSEAVAAWTEMLRDTLAAAAGLEQAVLASAQAAPEAIRPEVVGLSRRLQHEPLVEALEWFAHEVANPAADLVVAALSTAVRREARDLVPLLGALARSGRAEAEMRLRVHVGRTRIRTSVRVITATLVLFAGGLLLFNRPYLEPYRSLTGQLVLLVVGGIFGVGWTLLQRMARIKAPERFFGLDPAVEGPD